MRINEMSTGGICPTACTVKGIVNLRSSKLMKFKALLNDKCQTFG